MEKKSNFCLFRPEGSMTVLMLWLTFFPSCDQDKNQNQNLSILIPLTEFLIDWNENETFKKFGGNHQIRTRKKNDTMKMKDEIDFAFAYQDGNG